MIQFPELGRKGRLGNQLFQIASTIGTAQKNGCLFSFPKWHHQEDFSVPNGAFGVIHPSDSKYSDEHQFHHSPIPYRIGETLDLSGYFQSPKYWEGSEQLIRKFLDAGEDELDFIAVHVRRGDYCRFKEHYVQLFETGYYERAMKFFPNEKFLIFSDDIDFCMEKFGYNVHFSDQYNEIKDLRKMTRCKGLIMANSSYSWWGGYLGKPGRKIVTPSRWFGPALPHRTDDLYMPHWIKCE